MEGENHKTELVSLNKMGVEEFAKILVRLIQDGAGIRKAILQVVQACPNIAQRI